jgi:AdoMet-dependent rRNA methyltransferase SPB1
VVNGHGKSKDTAGVASVAGALGADEDFARLDRLMPVVPAASKIEAEQNLRNKKIKGVDEGGGFEEVPAGPTVAVSEGLDAVGLALASEMFVRRKKRDLIEAAYNRYAHNDDELPRWFADEEKTHMEPQLPMTKEMVAEIKERMREINDRPLKRVLEAKARKKKRTGRMMSRLTTQAETIMDNDALSGTDA